MQKIVINCTNLYVGGGVQLSISIINELKEYPSYNFFVFLSPIIHAQIEQSKFGQNFKFFLIPNSFAKLKTRYKTYKFVSKLEKEIKPDIVFTPYGPTYWRPDSKHVMGYAEPWPIYPKSAVYQQIPFIKSIKARLRNKYVISNVKRNADYYIVETEETKKGLIRVSNIVENKISVVGNTVSSAFDVEGNTKIRLENNDVFKFITISHNHPNKNLKIIKSLKNGISKLEKKVCFYLTIDQSEFSTMFEGCESFVKNLGPINVDECPGIYSQCDALFLPTLLECFSASYPEAMKMKLPIMTSDLSFSREICQSAGLYFNPLDSGDIIDKIELLIEDSGLREELVKNGTKRLSEFETAESRVMKYIEICKMFYEGL